MAKEIRFELNEHDTALAEEWMENHTNCSCGKCGEKFVYMFIPSTIGLTTVIRCTCRAELYLSGGKVSENTPDDVAEDIQARAMIKAVLDECRGLPMKRFIAIQYMANKYIPNHVQELNDLTVKEIILRLIEYGKQQSKERKRRITSC